MTRSQIMTWMTKNEVAYPKKWQQMKRDDFRDYVCRNFPHMVAEKV